MLNQSRAIRRFERFLCRDVSEYLEEQQANSGELISKIVYRPDLKEVEIVPIKNNSLCGPKTEKNSRSAEP